MSATIETYAAIMKTERGATNCIAGSMGEPLSTQTISGNFDRPQRQSIAAGAKRQLWDYTVTPQFAKLWVRIVTDGFLWLAIYIDTPTSATDPTPSGLYGRWQHLSLSCNDFVCLNSQYAYLHPTIPAKDQATNADGFPELWQATYDSVRLTANIYRLAAWNNSDAAIAEVETIVVY